MADKTALIGTELIFQDTSNDATITAYTWNFGDGNTSTNKNDTHIYSTIGTYTVTHSVTNTCGTTICTPKIVEIVTELPPPSDTGSTVMLMGAALLGFMMISKKKK